MSGTTSKANQGLETILLVDDDAAVRELVRVGLEQRGYTVLEAKFNSEALLIARRYTGPIHVMVADVMMPGLNGRELAYMLSSSRPHMKVLYITGSKSRASSSCPTSTRAFPPWSRTRT